MANDDWKIDFYIISRWLLQGKINSVKWWWGWLWMSMTIDEDSLPRCPKRTPKMTNRWRLSITTTSIISRVLAIALSLRHQYDQLSFLFYAPGFESENSGDSGVRCSCNEIGRSGDWRRGHGGHESSKVEAWSRLRSFESELRGRTFTEEGLGQYIEAFSISGREYEYDLTIAQEKGFSLHEWSLQQAWNLTGVWKRERRWIFGQVGG